MIEYFRNGGYPMWLMLFAAIGTVVFAAVRKREDRSSVLFGGAFACVVLGLFGLAIGMVAVAKAVPRFPEIERGGIVAQGLYELANNGSFGAALATILGIGAILTRKPVQVAA